VADKDTCLTTVHGEEKEMNQQTWHGKLITVADLPLPTNNVKPHYLARGRSVSRVLMGKETHCFDALSAQHAVLAVTLLNGE
jgi:hypothetical protein